MAEMIPESIAATDAPAGERRLFRFLSEALLPDEEFIVWHEPKVAKRRPDFLVWAQHLGLLVIEVKDWTLSQIVQTGPDRWIVRMNGFEAAHESPIEQARNCYLRYKELLQTSPKLRNAEGAYLGGLLFPIGFCAIFTQITRKQAEQNGILRAIPFFNCLFSDDLLIDTDSRKERRLFLSKLKITFLVRFSFTPLTTDQLKTLRALIFPEVRIRDIRKPLRTKQEEELVSALDLGQERIAKSIQEGHRILKGVAGSGKTLVLTCRAQYLQRLQPDWRILIVCYNRSLCPYIEQLLASDETRQANGIVVYHYHALVKTLLRDVSLARLEAEPDDAWHSRIGTMLRDEIRDGLVTDRYDAILIDEGQDFAVEWLHSLTDLLSPKTDSLLLCLDPAQNIFGRKVTYKSVGINVKGKRPVTLKTTYRNTSEILDLARRFSKVQQAAEEAPPESELDPEQYRIDSLLFPLDVDRHGSPPRLVHGKNPHEQIRFILEQIAKHIEEQACQWCDIGVLYADRYHHFASHFTAAFATQFGEERLYWVSRSAGSKRGLDLASPSVKLSTIESAKGLEFRIVFLVGLEVLPRPVRDEESERKLTYVGLTRAQDLLYLLADIPTGLFGELLEIANSTV